MKPVIGIGRYFEGQSPNLMARVTGSDAVAITQAAIASIAYAVYDLADTSAAVDSGTLTVADVVFDSLQTDARWTEDSTGYNFRWQLDGSQIDNFDVASGAEQKKRYRAEAVLTDTAGDKIVLVWQLGVTNVYSLEAS